MLATETAVPSEHPSNSASMVVEPDAIEVVRAGNYISYSRAGRCTMPIDYKSFQKLESLPPSTQAATRHDDDLLVLVKIRANGVRPSYISPRAEIGPQIFSAQIKADLLQKLESDPNVETVSISQRIPLLK